VALAQELGDRHGADRILELKDRLLGDVLRIRHVDEQAEDLVRS